MRRSLLLSVVFALSAAALPAAARADECDTIPEAGPRACASIDAGRGLAADLCDEPGVVPTNACGAVRGLTVDTALVDAYAASDLADLHALQRQLGMSLPLAEAQILSSHNSYNSSAYTPSLSASDANHLYSLTDQLRMDMREIELDVHTWYGVDGDARLPVLCHATGPQIGCSADRPLVDGLTEIRAWLDANPGEVIMIDVEDHLDGVAGHDEAAAAFETVLGDTLYRPAGKVSCAELPLHVSHEDIREAGVQVLLVSSCGAGAAWGAMVHTYGSWHQGRLGDFEASTCGSDYDRGQYDGAWTRYWEDTTWLSAMAGGPGPRLEGDTLRDAMACGLSIASLDEIHPQDPRLETLLWSWSLDARPMDAPLGAEAVIVEGRLELRDAASAGTPRTEALLCRRADGSLEVATVTTSLALDSSEDAAMLDLLCGEGTLATPRSARQMQLVREAVARYEAAIGPMTSPIRVAYAVTDIVDEAPVWTPAG